MHVYEKYQDNKSSERNTGKIIRLPSSPKSFQNIGKGSENLQKTDSKSAV